MALTTYSTLHLSIAMVAGFFALLHVGIWIALRKEATHKAADASAHPWVAAALLGFAAFDLVLAGGSEAAAGALGPALPWLVLTIPTALLVPLLLLRAIWAVLDLPVDRVRRMIAWVTFLLVLPGVARVMWAITSGDAASASWEASRYGSVLAALPYLSGLVLVGGTWTIEALRARATSGFIAYAALLAAVPALALMGREALIITGTVPGPTGIGLAGLPLALFASASMVARYMTALREAASSEEADARYRRLYRLGQGGMGEVWLGTRRGEGGFRRLLVLKRIRVDVSAQDLQARFWAEARVAARLHHPNIVAVHDFGRFDGGWFIVMEYLAGASLFDLLVRAYDDHVAIPPAVIVCVGEKICRGLECAHTHGVLHRDISPDNVIVTFDGEVKVLDFGIAKEADRAADPDHGGSGIDVGAYETVPGGIAGKKRYLAPERAVGLPAVVESDLFSVALVLVELFGVELPANGADFAGAPAPLSDAGLAAPASIEAVLRRALAPHPKQRYRSAAAMADDLAACARELAPIDLGATMRRMFPDRHAAAERLQALVDPTAEAVAAVLDAARPAAASGTDVVTRPIADASPARTERTERT